jgi:hypothetical protein
MAVASKVDLESLVVSTSVTQTFKAPFGASLGLVDDSIQVHSAAQVVGTPNICVLALDNYVNGAITLEQKAEVTGSNCAIFPTRRVEIA